MPHFKLAALVDFGGDLDKQWYIRYSVEKPDTGKLVRIKFSLDLNREPTVRLRRAKAKEMIQEVNAQLKKGWNPYIEPEPKIQIKTLREVLYEFLEVKRVSLRRRTYQSYKYVIDSFLKYLDQTKSRVELCTEVTPKIAREWLDWMSMQGRAGKTVNTSKVHLKVFFEMMVDRDMIPKNPFKGINKLPEDQGKNKAFTLDEREKIWSHLVQKNQGMYVFTRMIYFCYIRPVEILRLKVSDIDLSKSVILISGDQSKNRKTQSVSIPDAFKSELMEHISGSSPSDFVMGKKYKCSPNNMGRNAVSLGMNNIIRALGFSSDHSLYAFKHSGVVSAYQAGIDLYSISRQLRHHSLVITQIYLKSLGLMPNTEFASKMV